MNHAQVVGVCPRLDEVPIFVHHAVALVHAVAVEVANHHPSVIVDDVARAEIHGWWLINGRDGDSSKEVGDKELDVVNSAR